MPDEWRQAYLAEVGREIDNASSQLHETTNWSIGVVAAAISAVALATTAYPTRWTLAAVAIAWIFAVRFFVRSCIAYSYLDRWSKIRRAMVRLHLLSRDENKQAYESEFEQAIDLYDVKWKSATPLPSLIWSNLKLGYLQLFGVTLSLLLYGLFNSDSKDWMTWAVVTVVVIDLLYEIAIFPSNTYLQYKRITGPRDATTGDARPRV